MTSTILKLCKAAAKSRAIYISDLDQRTDIIIDRDRAPFGALYVHDVLTLASSFYFDCV
jgi:hypothetical protein